MIRAARSAAVAALATGATVRLAHTRIAREPSPRWQRRNHRDAPVTLAAGPAVAAGVLLGCAAAWSDDAAAAGLAVTVAAAAGWYDDSRTGDVVEQATKGWRGHLGALRRRRLSAGLVKAVAIGTGAVAAAAIMDRRHRGWTAIDAIVVAGTSHVANLLDLRPGRAGKVVVLAGGAVAVAGRRSGGALAAGVTAAAATALPGDLAEQTMLGDLGAGALGAGLGAAAAAGLSPRTRALWAGAVLALTVAAERVSFTRVIDRTPGLRHLDAIGRVRS